MSIRFQVAVDNRFSSFVNKVTVGQETNLPIKVDVSNNQLLVLKSFTSMKITGYYKFKNLDMVSKFVLSDMEIGIIGSRMFKKILDMNSNDLNNLIVKEPNEYQVLKMFILSNKTTTELPLSEYVSSEMAQPINVDRKKIFDLVFDKVDIVKLKKIFSNVKSSESYLGFNKNEQGTYGVDIISGEKSSYRGIYSTDIVLEESVMNELNDSVINHNIAIDKDGYNYLLKYQNEDISNILNVLDEPIKKKVDDDGNDIIDSNYTSVRMVLNVFGALVFIEEVISNDIELIVHYGTVPVSLE